MLDEAGDSAGDDVSDALGALSGVRVLDFSHALAGLPQIKSGKMNAIGLTSLERSPLMPDLQTVAEYGIPEFEYPSWFGIAAPARTPAALVNRINAEFVRVVKEPDISQ